MRRVLHPTAREIDKQVLDSASTYNSLIAWLNAVTFYATKI